MPTLPKPFRAGGRPTGRAAERTHDQYRGSARERGYSAAWDRASASYRAKHPLCEYCAAGAFAEARDSLTTRTDHLYPQRRFPGVFWLTLYWVASCDECDAAKQALEHQGRAALDRLAATLAKPILPTP
jgi:hypothetical protein